MHTAGDMRHTEFHGLVVHGKTAAFEQALRRHVILRRGAAEH